ncbi:MAG: hypothetical protein KDA51_16635, partial [Planctomycetales bacterium]|nr:hypothetical protein [Planctomycetales bacterium]
MMRWLEVGGRLFFACVLTGWALFTSALTGAQSVLTIAVAAALEETPSALPVCGALPANDCEASLENAIALVSSSQWQSSLPESVRVVRVRLVGGSYRIQQPLVIRWQPSGGHNVMLELVGPPGRTKVKGSVSVTNWYRPAPADMPERIRPQNRPRLIAADVRSLPLSIDQIPRARGYGIPPQSVQTELFVNGEAQSLAGWPNRGFGKIVLPSGVVADDKRTFSVAGRAVEDWLDEPDLMAHAFWKYDWAAQAYLVAHKDVSGNRLQLIGGGSPYGIASGQRIRIESALSELDVSGEWYLDRATRTLYYLPATSALPVEAELSVATTLLKVEDSKNVRISHIEFEQSRGDAILITGGTNVVLSDVN